MVGWRSRTEATLNLGDSAGSTAGVGSQARLRRIRPHRHATAVSTPGESTTLVSSARVRDHSHDPSPPLSSHDGLVGQIRRLDNINSIDRIDFSQGFREARLEGRGCVTVLLDFGPLVRDTGRAHGLKVARGGLDRIHRFRRSLHSCFQGWILHGIGTLDMSLRMSARDRHIGPDKSPRPDSDPGHGGCDGLARRLGRLTNTHATAAGTSRFGFPRRLLP